MKQRGKKKRESKEIRTTSGTSGTMLNASAFKSKESQKKMKDLRKYLRRKELKTSLK